MLISHRFVLSCWVVMGCQTEACRRSQGVDCGEPCNSASQILLVASNSPLRATFSCVEFRDEFSGGSDGSQYKTKGNGKDAPGRQGWKRASCGSPRYNS